MCDALPFFNLIAQIAHVSSAMLLFYTSTTRSQPVLMEDVAAARVHIKRWADKKVSVAAAIVKSKHLTGDAVAVAAKGVVRRTYQC